MKNECLFSCAFNWKDKLNSVKLSLPWFRPYDESAVYSVFLSVWSGGTHIKEQGKPIYERAGLRSYRNTLHCEISGFHFLLNTYFKNCVTHLRSHHIHHWTWRSPSQTTTMEVLHTRMGTNCIKMNKRASFLLTVILVLSPVRISSSSFDMDELQAILVAHDEEDRGSRLNINPLLLGVERTQHKPSRDAENGTSISTITNSRKLSEQRDVLVTTIAGRTPHCSPTEAPTAVPTSIGNLVPNSNSNGGTRPPAFVGIAAPPPTNPPTISDELDEPEPTASSPSTTTDPSPNATPSNPTSPASSPSTEIPVLSVDGFDPDSHDLPTIQPTLNEGVTSASTTTPTSNLGLTTPQIPDVTEGVSPTEAPTLIPTVESQQVEPTPTSESSGSSVHPTVATVDPNQQPGSTTTSYPTGAHDISQNQNTIMPPTAKPTGLPTRAPVAKPTTLPTITLSGAPTPTPTTSQIPSVNPTAAPSLTPTATSPPTSGPSSTPSTIPTLSTMPSESSSPSSLPSITFTPTVQPTSLEIFAGKHDRDEVISHKCHGMTTSQRTDAIIQKIAYLSGSQSLHNVQSPQFRAFNWVNRLDERIVCPQDESAMTQRFVLALFYFSMLGDNPWTNCDANAHENPCESDAQRWLGPESECNWYGVTCNQYSLVTHLDLQRNGLDGQLPVELFRLTDMQGLSLGHNGQIRGTVPLEIAEWTQLTYLDLDYNDLQGDFPNVYHIKTLQAVDLNNNRFSGTINEAIGQLTQLVVLQIENNQFRGKLPLDIIGETMDQLVLFSSQGNSWSKQPDWEALCDWVPDRRAVDSPGYLQFLLADCDTGAATSCSCCSVCF